MGVDGIGGSRGPLTPPVSGVQTTSGIEARSLERDEVGAVGAEAVSTSGAAEAAARAAGADVERVRLARGEITLEQYLDAEVVRATSHLEPQSSPALVEVIRSALREELASDPVLLALASRISAG